MSTEFDCTYCENLNSINEILPSSEEPIIVKNYYICKAAVFEVSFTKEELRKYYAGCTARIELTRHKFVDELLSEVDTLNIIFSQLTGEKRVEVIKIDTHLVAGLASPCVTQLDFFTKIGFLYSVLELKREPLRNLVKDCKPEEKGITLLKRLFKEYNQSDNGALNFFEKIIFVRDHSYPAHKLSHEVFGVLREMGLKYPISQTTEWQVNWDLTLRKFTDALRSIRKGLAIIAKVKARAEVS